MRQFFSYKEPVILLLSTILLIILGVCLFTLKTKDSSKTVDGVGVTQIPSKVNSVDYNFDASN